MPRHKISKVYLSRVKIRVSSQPLDMMRYDHCSPDTEQDAHKLHRVITRADVKPEDNVITFLRWSRTPHEPQLERWKSFGCEVLSWEAIND